MDIGKLIPTEITNEMQRAYLDYAMSVIVARALPDVKDGMKPVHRRILYAMHQMGLHHTARYTKSAKVVGEVLGKFHPHGDAPVYEAMVRLAQDFAMRYKLIDGQGNWGSVDGDPAAAMRYTECRLSAISAEMLFDIEKETVDFTPNFDNTIQEPMYLPAKLPNLLLMGSEGIAVGMATKIPPHNLGEVVDAIVYMIEKAGKKVPGEKFESEVTIEELMQFIKGPDFPTGATIYDQKEIANAYATGRGKIIMRAVAEIEEIGNGKSAIIITQIPYQVNKAQLVAHIADLVKNKKLEGISDLRDESDRHGMRVVVELKRDSRPQQVLNNLFKHTVLQTSFPVNIVAIVDGTPQTLTLKMILEEYIRHRQHIVVRRSEFELKEAKAREHILEGLKIAVDHIDEVIETIKKSKDADEAKTNLMKKFGLSELQSIAILDMQLRRLAALERQKIEDELAIVRETIAYLVDLLAHPEKILNVIKDELIKLREKYADERKTKVYKSKVGELEDADLIPNEPTVISITKTGYVKRQAISTFKMQQRGGVGVTGMGTKDEDELEHLIFANTHDNVLFFTNKGKVYQVKAWDLPEGSRQSKGQAIVNLISVEVGETVKSVLTYNNKDIKENKGSLFVFMTTRKGTVKKSPIKEYENIRKSGLISIKLEAADELVWTSITNGKDDIILISHEGKSIKFSETQTRTTARDTMGVRGILLKPEDYVVGMGVVKSSEQEIITITENGIGKRSKLSSFPKQGRGGQGVKAVDITPKTGRVSVARMIPDNTEAVILTSIKGQIVKLPISSVPLLGRTTQGVILMRYSEKGDSLAAATCITKE